MKTLTMSGLLTWIYATISFLFIIIISENGTNRQREPHQSHE